MRSIIIDNSVKISFKNNKLVIGVKEYRPNEIDFTDIFVDRILDGYISVKALRFLSANGINLHIQDYSGTIIGSYQQFNNFNGKLKVAQVKAYETRKEEIAKSILDAKLEAQHKLLIQLKKRYDIETKFKLIGKRLLTIEGNYANQYFNELSKVFNELYPQFHFASRNTGLQRHNKNANDPINSMLNYAYSVLQSLTLKYINYYGLIPEIPFLHEITANKTSLAFDLMEFIRPIGDLAVIQTLETKKLTWNDFTFSQLKTCRLMPNAQFLLNGILQTLLNKMIDSKQIETWHKENIRNFADALITDNEMKFEVIIPELNNDIPAIEILQNMSIEERKKQGISKTTLWYIQKNLKQGKPIKVYNKTKAKLH